MLSAILFHKCNSANIIELSILAQNSTFFRKTLKRLKDYKYLYKALKSFRKFGWLDFSSEVSFDNFCI